jgi:glycosyltransferase involved in cell wall biosynthesis
VAAPDLSHPVGLICGAWPPLKCGIGDFVHRLALELERQGRSVVVVTDRAASPGGPGRVRVIPLVRAWRPTVVPAVLEALKAHRVRVVNLHYPAPNYGRWSAVDLLPWAIRWRLGIPVVTTVHEFTSFSARGRLRVRALVRGSTAAIVTDPREREALAADAADLRDRVREIPLAPTLEPNPSADFDAGGWRKRHGAERESLVIAYIGFIRPDKGLDVLLEALAALPAELDFRVWILASRDPVNPRDAAYHHAIARRIEAHPRSGCITWTGYLESAEMFRYLTAADLAVLPYRDGASLRRTTLLSAIAHGLPALSTGSRAPCAGVEVVPPGDAHALAAAIARLGRDRSRLASLGEEARRAAESFRWPSVAARTAALLDQVTR